MLANVLGPLIAPLAGRAVDVASAAYLARTLSRLPPGASLPAADPLDQALTDAEGSSSSGGSCSPDGMRRMATDSWILSIGWVHFLYPNMASLLFPNSESSHMWYVDVAFIVCKVVSPDLWRVKGIIINGHVKK